jgi:alpha-galactosidase
MMKEKIVLIGAGSAMFTRGLVADLVGRGQELELALVDTNPEALEVAEKLARKMVQARRAPIAVSGAVDRRVVLKEATATICTVGVGGRRAWEQDVFVPRKYGIFQPVGDSVMPGGTSRALRMIPAMVAIAEDVLDLAPNALFFNYGNPMAPNCRAIRKATGAPVVGLCHGVFHVGHYLARMLGVPSSDLTYSAVGMNHMTWFVEARVKGQDAMPRLRQVAEAQLARLDDAEGVARREIAVEEISPFSWQLFLLFGAFPAVLDRHVSEFFPQFYRDGRYYGRTLGVDSYSVEKTIAQGDRIYEEMRSDALSEAPLGDDYFQRIGGEHEQVLDIIDSIRQEAGRVYSVNLPNTGQVPNLPAEVIIESPAMADGAGLRPIAQRPLSPGLVGTLATRLAWVETVVDAALEGSIDKVIQALVLDGSVSSLQMAEKLANDLLAVQAEYLPQFPAR